MDLLRVAAQVAGGGEDDFSKLFPPPKDLPADADVECFKTLALASDRVEGPYSGT